MRGGHVRAAVQLLPWLPLPLRTIRCWLTLTASLLLLPLRARAVQGLLLARTERIPRVRRLLVAQPPAQQLQRLQHVLLLHLQVHGACAFMQPHQWVGEGWVGCSSE